MLPDVIFNGVQHDAMFYLGDLPPEATSDGSAPDLHIYSNYQSGDIFGIGATQVTYEIQGLGIQCHFYIIVKGIYLSSVNVLMYYKGAALQ